jgi:hypothetical protein
VEWTEKWGMLFNVKKFKVMHVGRANVRNDYQMSGVTLEKTREEKDLGIVVSDTLKPSAHCAKVAMSVLCQITRAFRYHDRKIFVQLYKQYVRPHLDFAVQAWSPWQQADKDVLEKVQRKACMAALMRSG